MNIIGINFIEKVIYIHNEGQNGTETLLDFDFDTMKKLAPAECRTRSCLLWDFEAHTCTVCEDYMLTDESRNRGCIVVAEYFKPRKELVYPCNADFETFYKALGYEMTSWKEMLEEAGFPDFMMKYFPFDER